MNRNADSAPLQAALDELRLINALLSKISQVRESNHVMSIILSELIAATDADQGIISLISRMKKDELSTVVRGTDATPGAIPFTIDESISGWVLSNRRQVQVDNLDTDSRFSGLDSEDGRFARIVCSPMIVRDDVIGLVTLVRNARKPAFTEDHCRLAGILSAQGAHLLANARLMEELARKNSLLEEAQQRLDNENAQLRVEVGKNYTFENIVGKSSALKQVLVLASKFAANDSPVLITGETGTGKELIASAIHYNSDRRRKPFVVKNCGIKTESLLESELFGHVKGAFTGADRDKAGLFREANGGTIFLDEIGDAPLSTQAAVLRVLQTGEIRGVGASKTERVDVRVVSATNKDLKDEIGKGNFRQDLFYRLNTFVIALPPLRQRREDIPLLVHAFLEKLRLKLKAPNLTLTPAAMDILNHAQWPGNIRQLEHELERAAVVCGSDQIIDTDDLSIELVAAPGSSAEGAKGQLREVVERLERDLIAAALREHKGNLVRTSEALGLTRKGLKDKMTRYGMREESE